MTKTNEAPQRPGDRWVLSRDGVPVVEGTYQDCMVYIHRNHPYSVDHALKHEGYSIREVLS